ncbi:DUF1553 domain-containing protein [Haliscomenobacter hydrossis]|uniref:Cytochrome c domain-containing protein n=1 Tax=Haliscomenobacter hydrossis (strain ATCC 27775 / DSM 1100 / LMG 10767 / O) TaxID=760192 RepID=F4KVB6_HALH1|nr:DUF1553 domain-containing protein [Haliscomenobacter hydrossis]AEE50242.1 protein of unknown function DUF1549 [Haliscomenobacter hydrossis DSM 1100]
MSKYTLLLAASLFLCYACSTELPPDLAAELKTLPSELDYNLHVKPILSDKCFACHGPDKAKQKAGLRLDIAEAAYARLEENPGKVAIAKGSLRRSEVFHRIISTDPEYLMPSPASHLSLSNREKAILIKWIKDGAEYQPHWAFVAPKKTEVPKVKKAGWVKNPIDNFIVQKLEEEKLAPSPEASKEILLRRLSLDLTGLPPTLTEIDAFLQDKSPKAYEKQVDRLLNSPHYGEKMAVDWLDLARFADSHGYTVDRLRDMSPYRDWVIQAFNANQKYDQFIQWQLAGDMMPKPSKDMIIATAFNRNHPQNMEGGIIEEEFQTEYVVDRTNTFGEAFMGLSLGCAKCHDHKYDPLSQQNYYEIFSFFNNVKEAGQISWNSAPPTPTLMLPTEKQEKIIRFIQKTIAEQEQKITQLQAQSEPDFKQWLQSGAYQTLAKAKIPQNGLQAHYTFEDGDLKNSVNPKQIGIMKRETGMTGDKPDFVATNSGKALKMEGDVYLDLNEVGVFRKSEPFSIGIKVNIPKGLKEGVIFHKSSAERLYNFRGYHLYLKNDRLEINMAHTAPSNAISRVSQQPVPRDRWIQLTLTYDGSSRAEGFKLYQDGQALAMETTMDQLYKDIIFNSNPELGLQIGAWWRGLGFKGGQVDDIMVYQRELTPFEVEILAQKQSWPSIVSKKHQQLSAKEVAILQAYYQNSVSPGLLAAQKALQISRTQLSDSSAQVEELMVMQEMTKPKKTFLLQRGNYDMSGKEVFPNTPSAILPFPNNLPKNRLGLAQWLCLPEHPLTARVAVNRFWQNFFGAGLVKTTEDFGNQGELPSHLALLDWLALSFVESGWDIKALNKLIVMSATYRQSSKVNKNLREKDPENRFLARGPAYRMSAEMIRDNALTASGLLNKKIGGKSIKPYQPQGLWEINSANYAQDTTDAVYRRSLYIVVKRSVPHPTLATFDAGSRSYCVVRRQKTNTPLQALVTLNDPTFLEASKVLGVQMCNMPDARKAIVEVYRRLTGRQPAADEVELLLGLQKKQREKFQQNPEKTRGWLNAGLYKVDPTLDVALLAANAVVANTILNSDATLTRR